MQKICPKCKILKNFSEFRIDRHASNGRGSWCLECAAAHKRGQYHLHPEKPREYARIYTRANREKIKEYRLKNREKMKPYWVEWCRKNKEKRKEIERKQHIKRRSTAMGKLNCNLGSAISTSLAGKKNGRHWETLVDFTLLQLKEHLEEYFQPGMSWDNYGKGGWHVDHKLPLAVHNFKVPGDIDFKRCWNLGNLQPLWEGENIKKGAKIKKPFQPSLAI